jgi:hypothetical protein
MTAGEAARRLAIAERELRAARSAGRSRDVAAFSIAVAVLEDLALNCSR